MGTAEQRSLHHSRIRAAFEGRWADRVPICEQCFASTAATACLGRNVHTGTVGLFYFEALAWAKGESAYGEFVEQVYRDSWALQKHFDFDIWFWPWLMGRRPTRQIDKHTFLYGNEDGDNWSVWKFDPGSYTFGLWKSARPAPDFEEVEGMMRQAIAGKPSSRTGGVPPMIARAQKDYGHQYVIAGSSGMSIPMQEGWLEATVLDPGLLGEYLDLAVEQNLAAIEAQAAAGIYVINGGGDFAFKSGPIYSPAFFDNVMAPRWKRLFDRCRELGVYYILRSDGNLWPVAESLFGRSQPHAYYECDYDAGMRFEDLRARFPNLTLMGNVSCSELLNGTPELVRQRATECIAAAAPRIVLASANSILHGTPPENIYALYEAARSYPLLDKS